MKEIFVAAINCIDGRVQYTVLELAKAEFKADYVDMITEPGPDKVLSDNSDADAVGSIKRKVLLSVEKHYSRVIVIAGHHDCAANPVEKEEHIRQIAKAVDTVKEWGLEVDVYGAWVDSDWKAVLLR